MKKLFKLSNFVIFSILIISPHPSYAEFKGWIYKAFIPGVPIYRSAQGALSAVTSHHISQGICSVGAYSLTQPYFPGCGNSSGRTTEWGWYTAPYVTGGACQFDSTLLAKICRGRSVRQFKEEKSTEGDNCPGTSESSNSSSKDPKASNPIRISTGEKIQTEYDYQAISPSKIQFIRYYSSHNVVQTTISPGWSHNYDKKIHFTTEMSGLTYAAISRFRGKLFEFTRPDINSNWTTDADIKATLTSYATYHELKLANDIREQYDLNGNLISIVYINGYQIDFTYYTTHNQLETATDNLGNTLTFIYNSKNQLSELLTPDSRQFLYSYVPNILYPNAPDLLDKISNIGDNTTKSYVYDDANKPGYLSGIIDERGIRYATWTYDTYGKATTGEHANGVEKLTFLYTTDASGNPITTVTNSNNQATVYSYEVVQGVALSSAVAGPGCATCGAGDTSYTYDPLNGNLLTKTTKGITTEYSNYDINHNARTMVEAFGTPEVKTTTYTFDPQYYSRIASKIELSVFATGNKLTTYSYDTFGNVTNVNTDGFTPTGIPVNRTIALQYNGPLKQLTQIDGPRPNIAINDVTTLDYYPNTATNGNNRARLKSVSQSGILLRNNIQYTASGKVSSETRTNGLTVNYSYYPGNDRLKIYTETVGVKSRITQLTYLPTGEVETITLAQGTPDSLMVTLGYDAARRLTSVKDAVNNRIEFVLDTESNVTDKNIFDNVGANGTLKRTLHQVFDIYSRLESITQANEVSDYKFSPDGTLTLSSVGDSLVNEKTESTYQYDGLKRLTSITQNTTGTDPTISNLLIQYGYDVNDNLTSVIDANDGTTTYVYDDLGNLLSQTSPDTGVTSFINDAAGNRTQQTDANNIVLAYSYDGLNRIESITGINASDNISVSYDTCIGGLGRLCGFTDVSGITGYEYDEFGRTSKQTHTELNVTYNTSYSYNLLDRITQIILPSGRIVNKNYNTNAQVSSIDATVAGTMSVLIDNASYAADGQLSGFTYGNGYTERRTFDMAGRITDQSMPKTPIVIIPTPDTTAPVVTAPLAITTEATTTSTPVTLGTATALDNIDGTLIPTANNTGPYPLGITTVTWNATDAAGNIGTATQTVTITDTTAPTITAPANVSVVSDVALAVTLGTPTFSDLFGPVTTSNDAPALFSLGTTTVTWTVTDVNGNSAIATQTVTVTATVVTGPDVTAPVVTAPANIIAEATTTKSNIVAIGTATAIDNVDGSLTAVADKPGPYEIGITTVTWTAIDSAGNEGLAEQLVTVQDSTSPVITAPAAKTEISDVAIEIDIGQATASDLFLSDIYHNAPKFFPLGTTTVTWTAIDDYANTATATQLITVSPVALNQSTPFKTVSLLSSANDDNVSLSTNTFTIDENQQSTVVLVMVTDELGKTMPPKAWYQEVKQGRWTALVASHIANLKPDVLLVVSDTKIDLWQQKKSNTDKSRIVDHQQQVFNGKAWALSKSLQQVNHVAWTPSQPDPLLRSEVNWQYAYDSKGNIITRTVDTTAQTFVYDALDRLTDDVFSNQVYGYDKNSNRVALTDNGVATSLVYDANSNRMNTNAGNAIVLDNVGNTTSDVNHNYGYNDHNRLTSVDTNISYVYNALGQRTRKVTPSGTTIYHYDLDGQLISETTETGVAIKDYVYLDNQPIAQLSDVVGQPVVVYVHTDHLDTPRKVTDSTGKVIWSWDSDAFGKLSANTDPDGDGVSFEMNLRFAGQYFDSESGLHYNYFRYYDPSTGRYITSDPIGLNGGLNTFGYVGGNPLYWSDPFGLVEGSKSNKAKRKRMAEWATARNGSTWFSTTKVYAPGYSYDNKYGPQYPTNSWKCSAFTCAAAAYAGASTKVNVPDGNSSVNRCATAGELTSGNVPDWRDLGPGEVPEPGDFTSTQYPYDPTDPMGATGHTTVVISDGLGGTTTIGAHENRVGPPGADNFNGQPTTTRRYTGD